LESQPALNTGLLPAFLLRCGYGAQNPWMGPKTIVVCLWIMRLVLSLALAILVLAPSYAAAGEPTYQVGDQFQVGDRIFQMVPQLLPPAEPFPPAGEYAKHTDRALPPPEEYDHPYKGQLTIARGDARTMTEICPKTSFPVTLGCNIRYIQAGKDYSCHVFIAEDEILKTTSWSYRHLEE